MNSCIQVFCEQNVFYFSLKISYRFPGTSGNDVFKKKTTQKTAELFSKVL